MQRNLKAQKARSLYILTTKVQGRIIHKICGSTDIPDKTSLIPYP